MKKIIAVLEIGHSLVGFYIKDIESVETITIIPHGDEVGYIYTSTKYRFTYSQKKCC